jgi:hypothetical protein
MCEMGLIRAPRPVPPRFVLPPASSRETALLPNTRCNSRISSADVGAR